MMKPGESITNSIIIEIMRRKGDQSEWFKLAYLINCKPFSQQKVAQKAAMCSLDIPRDDIESS